MNNLLIHNFVKPPVPMVEPTSEPEVFNAEFIERRLEEHQLWQELAPAIEWTRYCYACNGEHNFVADRTCEFGLIGKCAGCGDERVAPFTRATTEAA